MIQKTLAKVFGTKHEREMKKLQPLIDQINSLESKYKSFRDDDLRALTPAFRQRLENGESLDSVLPEAYAALREASIRVLGMRHYDVQMIGGIVLHRGGITEMRTGEGKTLVATLPCYLNALPSRGVHVVTVNDYLAKRDEEWMGQLYRWMGLTTGTIVHDLNHTQRQKSYAADITYGTNNEFGFDYLRDNMSFELEHYVQRELNFAIIDECDSILVDEARTPLIISGPAEDSVEKYYEINKIIPSLKRDIHFTLEEKSKTVSINEEGSTLCEQLLQVGNLYEPGNIELLHFIYQGLKAHHLFQLDVDYMVKDGEIVIVDEFTGRLMPGRRWSEGLHQAIEAKENLKVRSENQTLATITFQNYFRMYNKFSGMTGTAETEALEFKKIYNLDVTVIPTNKPIKRKDHEDVVYKTEAAKFRAIAKDIKERKAKGQPVLVGTVSIEKSERLSRMLKSEGITHNVLNAKQHEREAEIVAQAGRFGSVTIATNMAGRGTDIVLGGNSEFMAKAEVANSEAQDSEVFRQTLEKYQALCEEEKGRVIEAGGLYIVGTERHESRRIDNQLRGRSGRQGDPGASCFYLSLEDNLMRIFNGERIQKIMSTLNVPEDEPIISGMVSRAIEGAQRKVEGHQFDIRKHLLEYDDVMNQQRKNIYTLRRQVLEGEMIERIVLDMLGDLTSTMLDIYAPESAKIQDWYLEGLNTALKQQFGVSLRHKTLSQYTSESLTEEVSQAVKDVYEKQKTTIGDFFSHVQKMVLLQTIDTRWKEHLASIDQLKEGINLRAYAQKDPLIEYKKESFKAFEEMQHTIKSESIEKLLKIQIVTQEEARQRMELQEHDTEYDYSGADDSDLGTFSGGMPFAQPTPGRDSGSSLGQSMSYSRGDDQDNGLNLNRAERRRRERMKKRKR
ncbi:MAG: preprotein translocase subunit SecA [Bdellovibrionaceae bacterium]|nr:preprotein translocase subunit SecA [Pseudobdellovibrionaceae bacterium]